MPEQENDWKIPEYEIALGIMKELEKKIKNPKPNRLHSDHISLKEQFKEMDNDRKLEAYRFLRFYAISPEEVQFVKGKTSGQYAIFRGERTEANYPRLLFFQKHDEQMRLPVFPIASAEEFEEIPVKDFVLAVLKLF